MRTLVAVAVACSTLVSLAQAQDLQASIRKSVSIPAQELSSALQEFAQERKLYLIFDNGDVVNRRTAGASGELTQDEVLKQLLQGTGLTYKLLDSKTVTIVPIDTGGAPKNSGGALDKRSIRQAQNDAPSSAQTATSSAPAPGGGEAKIEEIIVTATKRAENIRDVPISMTALTAEEISERRFFNGEDYLRGLPSVNQTDLGGRLRDVIIRGIGGFGGTTSAYFGETPTSVGDYEIKLVDIERVEVLRGPQGTGLGRSSMGGTLRVIPKAPELDSLSGSLSGNFSRTSEEGEGNYGLQLVGNIPLMPEKLALRVVGYRNEDGGFYRNLAASDPLVRTNIITPFNVAESFAVNKDHVGDFLVEGGRAALLLQPIADLKLTLNYLSQKAQNDGLSIANIGTYQQNLLQVAPEHVIRGETGGVTDVSIEITNLMLEYDRDWASVVASYSHTEGDAQLAQPQQYFTRNWPVSYRQDDDSTVKAAEVRLVTNFDGPVNFIAGVFHEDTESSAHYNYVWFGDPATNFFVPLGAGARNMGEQTDRDAFTQKAVFGEVSWKFLSRFTLTGGGRAFEYDRTTGPSSRSGLFGATTAALSSEDSGSIFKGNLSYKANENTMLYGGISEGFRLGGPQVGLPISCDPDGDGIVDGTQISIASTRLIRSDTLKNYELGVKFASEGSRLSVDAALFRMDWTGLPVAAVPDTPTCRFSYSANAGDARSEGFEIQASFRLTDAFTVEASGSKVKAQLLEDAPSIGLKGDRLPGSPQTNASLGLRYQFGIAGYDAFVRSDSIYVGEFFGNIAQSPTLRNGDYVRHDLVAGIALKSFDIGLFIRNLTSEDAFVGRGGNRDGGFLFGNRLRPRTIGLQVSYEFGQ